MTEDQQRKDFIEKTRSRVEAIASLLSVKDKSQTSQDVKTSDNTNND